MRTITGLRGIKLTKMASKEKWGKMFITARNVLLINVLMLIVFLKNNIVIISVL